MCLAFGPDQITYSGSDNGSVYVWKGSKLKFVLQDLHKGPIHTIYMSVNGYATCADDGSFSLWTPSFEAIRAFPLRDTYVGSHFIHVLMLVHRSFLLHWNTCTIFLILAVKRIQ